MLTSLYDNSYAEYGTYTYIQPIGKNNSPDLSSFGRRLIKKFIVFRVRSVKAAWELFFSIIHFY